MFFIGTVESFSSPDEAALVPRPFRSLLSFGFLACDSIPPMSVPDRNIYLFLLCIPLACGSCSKLVATKHRRNSVFAEFAWRWRLWHLYLCTCNCPFVIGVLLSNHFAPSWCCICSALFSVPQCSRCTKYSRYLFMPSRLKTNSAWKNLIVIQFTTGHTLRVRCVNGCSKLQTVALMNQKRQVLPVPRYYHGRPWPI